MTLRKNEEALSMQIRNLQHKKIMRKNHCNPTARAGDNFDIELVIILMTFELYRTWDQNESKTKVHSCTFLQISEMGMFGWKPSDFENFVTSNYGVKIFLDHSRQPCIWQHIPMLLTNDNIFASIASKQFLIDTKIERTFCSWQPFDKS
uniref:Uncharacterized protein n=1 Tax=Romanomermis culicivorax TaxID=13658 RepID=A0A915JS10_ROMCU